MRLKIGVEGRGHVQVKVFPVDYDGPTNVDLEVVGPVGDDRAVLVEVCGIGRGIGLGLVKDRNLKGDDALDKASCLSDYPEVPARRRLNHTTDIVYRVRVPSLDVDARGEGFPGRH